MGVYSKIIALDFDGVLHSYESGWKGANVVADGPVPGAIEWLRQMLADDRFEIHILSSRNSQAGGIEAMVDWLRKYLSDDEVERVVFPHQKPPAFLTIDDRAYCFEGEFPTVDWILKFKPWNAEA